MLEVTVLQVDSLIEVIFSLVSWSGSLEIASEFRLDLSRFTRMEITTFNLKALIECSQL